MLLPTTPAFLRHQSRRCGPAGGFVDAGRVLTFEAFADTVEELDGWFAHRNIGTGHPIGLMMGNGIGLLAMLYAAWGRGAVPVPVSVRSTASEVAARLRHAQAVAIIADPARADTAGAGAKTAGVPAWACGPARPLDPHLVERGRIDGRPAKQPSPSSLAAIAYTSGSSGHPKGVVLSHENMLWAGLSCAQARGDGPETVGACLSPLTHIPVLVSHVLARVLVGARSVLFDRFDVDRLYAEVAQWGISDISLIGGMVFDVLEHDEPPTEVIETIRKVSVGGTATPIESKTRLAERFPHAELIEAYGQTETTDGVLMARGDDVLTKPDSVGRVNPFVAVAILRADGRIAGPDEEGEIVVSGPTVMRGYHRDQVATQQVMHDGWLRTGDLGRCDAEGYFYVSGRSKEVIISGGENVSPREVEEVLRAHPDVDDVAVIGTPHPRWGEQVTAVVVRRADGGLDAAALTAFAAERLAGFKKPQRIEFVDALPRNAYNKVETHLLREQLGG